MCAICQITAMRQAYAASYDHVKHKPGDLKLFDYQLIQVYIRINLKFPIPTQMQDGADWWQHVKFHMCT